MRLAPGKCPLSQIPEPKFVIARSPRYLRSTLTGKLTNEDTGEAFELKEVSSVGRSRDSVVLVPDPRVSRRHALIRAQEDGYWLFDLGSVNGSYLNGRRVTTAQLLKTGDVIKIGSHRGGHGVRRSR